MIHHQIHVSHHLVDQIPYAAIIMELLHVLVYKIILEDRQIAVQNVQSMQSAREILLVLMTNVKIHAPDLVVYTQHVMP